MASEWTFHNFFWSEPDHSVLFIKGNKDLRYILIMFFKEAETGVFKGIKDCPVDLDHSISRIS